MPESKTAKELVAAGKLYYGDPCYDSTFGSTHAECEKQGNLALAVFRHYGIEVANTWNAKHASCCPLDLLNQDPFSCIKMSLMASLLNEEYWEVYADEWGRASFVRVLPEASARIATLPRVQYCVPSLQPADIANLVVVRSADPPPFRKCGKIHGQEWYNILDGASSVGLRNIFRQGSIFPGKGAGDDARGIRFSWGEVTGMGPSASTDPTCAKGVFEQYGTIIYPDYERKQIYNDGVIDFYELEGFEQILFWLVDVDYNSTQEELAHYNIQFVKSSEIPILLNPITVGDTWYGHVRDFGVVCDVSDDGLGTGTSPDISLSLSKKAELADQSCQSVQKAVSAAKERQQFVAWDPYSVPSFFGYGFTRSSVSFNEYSKWNIVGAEECIDNPIDNMYEATVSLWGNGTPLDNWNITSFLTTSIFFGQQKGKRTIEIPQGSCWVESGDDSGNLIYSLRAEAPSKASSASNQGPWTNPFHNYMLAPVTNAYGGTGASNFLNNYKYPGNLFGWDDGLYLIGELWSKVKIARPGIAIHGFGRDVKDLMPRISLRIKPVYQIDFPAAIAAKGELYNGCVDVYKDLANANQAYCKPIPSGPTEAEKLQEAMTGNTIDITIPFLFPDFVAAGQNNPSQVTDKRAFDALCNSCLRVATFLWEYIDKYKNEPYKGYTYVCGPPKSQNEVPRLGDVIETEHGKRTINSIAYSYSDGSSFTLNVEVGPVQISTAHAGAITNKRKKNEEVKGKIVDQGMGALYKVDVSGIGIIQAWNIDRYPWDVGDKVSVTLYNHPTEL